MNDNDKKNKHTGGKFMLGAALAAGVGYLAGILTAPKSGKETRQDIEDKVVRTKEEAEKKLNELNSDLGELVEKAKNKSGELSDKAKAELKDAVAAAKDAQSKASTLIAALRKGEAEDPELNKAIKQASQAKQNLIKFFKN